MTLEAAAGLALVFGSAALPLALLAGALVPSPLLAAAFGDLLGARASASASFPDLIGEFADTFIVSAHRNAPELNSSVGSLYK
jgi:hypothetical protein